MFAQIFALCLVTSSWAAPQFQFAPQLFKVEPKQPDQACFTHYEQVITQSCSIFQELVCNDDQQTPVSNNVCQDVVVRVCQAAQPSTGGVQTLVLESNQVPGSAPKASIQNVPVITTPQQNCHDITMKQCGTETDPANLRSGNNCQVVPKVQCVPIAQTVAKPVCPAGIEPPSTSVATPVNQVVTEAPLPVPESTAAPVEETTSDGKKERLPFKIEDQSDIILPGKTIPDFDRNDLLLDTLWYNDKHRLTNSYGIDFKERFDTAMTDLRFDKESVNRLIESTPAPKRS